MTRWLWVLILAAIGAVAFLIFRKHQTSGANASGGEPTGSNFDSGSSEATSPATVNLENKIALLAQGIMLAEGGDVSGSRPNRNNNPGDLRISGDQGFDDQGYGVFSSRALGDQALANQCRRILTGDSAFYSDSMTWQQVADTYDQGGDSSAWLANVASVAGMTPDQTVADWRDS